MSNYSRQKIAVDRHNRPKCRYLLSILVGLVLGFALSFACLPLMNICENSGSYILEPLPGPFSFHMYNGSFSLRNKFDSFRILNRQARSIADVTLVDYGSKDYEPRIHPIQPASVKSNKNGSASKNKTNVATTRSPNVATVARPRYIADELGIREKVLVAVLTETEHLNTFGLFLNHTLQDHVNRLLFFIDDNVLDFPRSMQVIAIHDKRKYLKPFYVVKYLAEKMVKQYDWFFIVPDHTYIRGYKLNEFLNHISVGQDLYMGQVFGDKQSVYCYFGGGMILSGSVIQKIYDSMDWCTKNAYSLDLTDNFGRCVLKAAKIPCTNTASNYKFSSYINHRFEFDTHIENLSKTESFNKTLTIHPVSDLQTMLKLQKYFNEVEIDELAKSVAKYEQTIERLSCYAPEGCGNIPWPVGVPPPFKPPTRFDVLRWDYFNETHMFLKSDNAVIDPLNENDYADIHEVIDHSVTELKKKYRIHLEFKKLLNGYRQFDPTRGTHYILDIVLIDTNNVEYIKRAELMRPLGLVEIVPMPFVTETTKLFLILPMRSEETSAVISFLRFANRTLFDRETRDKFELLLTHIVSTKDEYSKSNEWFEAIRLEVNQICQTQKQLVITYHTLLLPSSSVPYYSEPIHLLEFFQSKLRNSSLVFITNPHVDIDSDFLNRCRLNAIENTQVFFPIVFQQYHPNIVALTRNTTSNSTIEIHKFVGWFNSYVFSHIGIYMSDYMNLKKYLSYNNISMVTDNLYDLFIQYSDVHVLRAPDQSLRAHYQPIHCDTNVSVNLLEHNRCLAQQEKGLASRSQLAMMVIEHEQTKISPNKT